MNKIEFFYVWYSWSHSSLAELTEQIQQQNDKGSFLYSSGLFLSGSYSILNILLESHTSSRHSSYRCNITSDNVHTYHAKAWDVLHCSLTAIASYILIHQSLCISNSLLLFTNRCQHNFKAAHLCIDQGPCSPQILIIPAIILFNMFIQKCN